MRRPVEPWTVTETGTDPDRLAAAASLLTLSNGWVGVRGALEELHPWAGPGTLMAAVHDDVPLTYAEPAYGYPPTSEHLVPVPDAWAVRVVVDGTPLRVTDDGVQRHTRTLDLRRGVLRREVDWRTPSGAEVAVRTRRLVSLARREVVVSEVEVAATTAARVELDPFPCCERSPGAGVPGDLPPDRPALVCQTCGHTGTASWTVHRAARSGVAVAVRGEIRVEVPDGVVVRRATRPHATTLTADLPAGAALRLTVPVAYTTGPPRSTADQLLAHAQRALDGVRSLAWDALEREHAAVLEAVWRRSDVEVDGDDEVQQAVRVALLHVVQAAAASDDVGIRAKGLTGTGYDGHTFWDADSHVTPVLDHVLPAGARAHVRWRHATLPQARERAAELGLPGAAYPWRTISGRECSGYWPAGTAAAHVTADVADAAVRHAVATQDEGFTRDVVLEIVVEAARFWTGMGRWGSDGAFHVDGVTGPDEYSALVDDDTFTNLVVGRVLRAAADLAGRFPTAAHALGVTDDERAGWARAGRAVAVPRDERLGVTQQSRGSTERAVWDFEGTTPDDYPLHSTVHYSVLYRHQVLKQADVVAAAHLVGEAFTTEQKRRDLDYYEPLTVRDSSLSAPSQAVVAAEVGYLDLAWAYTRETALVDLHDNGRPTQDGVHVAALAGAWTALVVGFGGLREHDGGLHLRPALPPGLRRLAFGLRRGASVVRVEVLPATARYRLVEGPALELTHDGEAVVLTPEAPQATRRVAPRPAPGPTPQQPRGREPKA